METKPLSIELISFWREMYADPEVQRQMYAVPDLDDEQLLSYFQKPQESAAFVVFKKDKPIGGFTIQKELSADGVGSFGVVIHRKFRNKGYGTTIIKLVEKEAKNMGFTTLRADVYSDNQPAIIMLQKTGFRTFIWFEKNLI